MNVPARITKNQNIQRQERNCVNRPPSTGAIAGAIMGPDVAQPIHMPRSALVAMSATTPEPSAIVLAEPVDCRHRRTRRAANVLQLAIPMHAPM